jgi:tryptophanyl-tRNA synthetase
MAPLPTGRIILTGDRPTGHLHLGHYAGSLANRVALQNAGGNVMTILVADTQALTDNARDPEKIRRNVLAVVEDYLAVGIDPSATRIALQSELRALPEMAALYANLIPVGQLERNPTIRSEIVARGFGHAVPAGFLCYPLSQAADITAFSADLVPAGEDQAPLIELTNDVVDKVNAIAGKEVLRPCSLLTGQGARLPGVDGKGKMSKSAGNSIPLSADADTVRAAVMSMYTDSNHLKVSDPGQVEGNVVFAFLDAFDPIQSEVADLKDHYRAGGLGDMALKRRLVDVLQSVMDPIRRARSYLNEDVCREVLYRGTMDAKDTTEEMCDRVRRVFGLSSFF